MSVLTACSASVSAEGETVVLRIGNWSVSMPFEFALALSAALLMEARAARLTTQVRRMKHTAGLLHNATARPSRVSRFRKALPPFLAAHRVRVRHVGSLVHMTIEGTTADLPFNEAMKLSQWLRLQGKQARNTAGELAHWTSLGLVPNILAGERMN